MPPNVNKPILYEVFKLRENKNTDSSSLLEIINQNKNLIENQGSRIFGIFGSLLGLATNEIYLVTYGEDQLQLNLNRHVEIMARHSFRPTVRPTNHEPAKNPGVYVFRWFSIDPKTVDEVASLSAAAWPDFESSFDTKVQGLFTESSLAPNSMLLLTWYSNLSVWEDSRNPPKRARESFIRRHKLTLSALPVATTLLSIPENSLGGKG